MTEFSNLNDLELLSLIKRAEEELERRKASARARLKEEIQEKIRASGLELNDLFPEASVKKRKTRSSGESGEPKEVKGKFRDPVSQDTWSGRGAHPPYWVKKILAERGWTLDEFKQSGEYEA